MIVVVSLEHRFSRTPDGRVWSQTMFPYLFWTRYLEVFDGVRVVARVRDVDYVSDDHKRCDGEGVAFHAIPYYQGPAQYLKSIRGVQRAAVQAVDERDAVILRLSSIIGSHIYRNIMRSKKPFGVEVVGDPYDVFAPGAMRHPLRKVLRLWSPRRLRLQCAHASAVAYVSNYTLAKRYPCYNPDAFITNYSSIQLDATDIALKPKKSKIIDQSKALVFVGTLEQMYKAPDILIDAVAKARAIGTDLTIRIIGDGKHRPELEARSKRLGLDKYVLFKGTVSGGNAVLDELDKADVFVLPSYTEGLPRGMIEAMARGLPCIGSNVGGIPELLPPEDMVPPGNAVALAQKIIEVVNDPERMEKMSARNLKKAKEYKEDVLRERRIAFYRYIRERTEEWIQTK